mmetsp:Transcript_18846/g.55252  ORF Transcript_18846/g.55252 Transcript_18846/m.55252 type:complete len:568 (+) Transcript_18846:105-1808(+)
MGRILVMYHSNTDCTAQMAKHIADGARQISGHEVRLKSCDEAEHSDVLWCDAIACGTPTNLGGVAWRMKKWWDEFAADNWSTCDGKLCTTFSSQGGHGGGAEMSCQAMANVLLNFGFLFFGVTDYIGKINTCHYGAVVAKQPRNEVDRLCCQRLGLRMAEWTAVYVDGRKTLHPQLTTKAADRAAESGTKFEAPTEAPLARAVHVTVTKEVPESEQARWLEMAEELAHHTWQEAGCLKYNFVKSLESKTRFVISEEWASEAHLEAHFATPHFTKLVPQMDAISETVSIDKCADALAKRPVSVPGSLGTPAPTKTALIFTKATAFLHDSLGPASSYVRDLFAARGYDAIVSDESALMEAGAPKSFDVICLVQNSGEIFNPETQILQEHVRQGKGVLGIHAALACFLDGEDAVGGTPMGSTCSVIQDTFGAHFYNHPVPQTGRVTIHKEAALGVSAKFGELPDKFDHHDEFFNFNRNPTETPDITVLASVDESTYEGGVHGESHPLVWCRELGENKAPIFYSALGHFSHFYDGSDSPHVRSILRAGVDFIDRNSLHSRGGADASKVKAA